MTLEDETCTAFSGALNAIYDETIACLARSEFREDILEGISVNTRVIDVTSGFVRYIPPRGIWYANCACRTQLVYFSLDIHENVTLSGSTGRPSIPVRVFPTKLKNTTALEVTSSCSFEGHAAIVLLGCLPIPSHQNSTCRCHAMA